MPARAAIVSDNRYPDYPEEGRDERVLELLKLFS